MAATDALHCPACNATLVGAPILSGIDRLHGTPGRFEVVCCDVCGTGTTLPRAADEQLASLYPEHYGPYDDRLGRISGWISQTIRGHQGRRALARKPLSSLLERSAGTLIDVGCGRGDLAALFVGRGWRAVGVEPSAAACATARRRGVDARQGTLADVQLEESAYDAAIFHHSLEHSPDPARDLATIRAALRVGGVAVVSVPNFGSWQRRRFGDRWFHLDLPRHRTHFTAAGLTAALTRAGLDVEWVGTSTSVVGLPGTLQYALVGRCLFPRGLGLRVASGLCVIVLPFARLLDLARGGGDQLHAVALRRA